MESGLLLLGKWITIPIAALVGFLTFIVKGMYTKQTNTYTKAETEQLIDLKIKPVSTCIDHNTKVIEKLESTTDKLMEVLQRLEVDHAKVQTKVDSQD